MEGRTKKEVNLTDGQNLKTLVISWPSEWDTDRVTAEIHKAIRDLKDIELGKDTDEFPDLELMEGGPGLSLGHLS